MIAQLRSLLLCFSAVLIAQPAPQSTPPPAFTSIRASASYKRAIAELHMRYETSLSTHCPKLDLQLQNTTATVLAPFQTDPQGNLISAHWRESTPGTACGETRLYNTSVTIRDGKPQILPLLPGYSLAAPLLQHDAGPYAASATATASTPDCKPEILNTALPAGQNLDAKHPWIERWTVRACGKQSLVTLHFIPDASGTTIQSTPGETVPLP
jgi:hypothetical protein